MFHKVHKKYKPSQKCIC